MIKSDIYPVVFKKMRDHEGEEYFIVRPIDVDAVTQGYGWDDALYMARDLLCNMKLFDEEQGNTFPRPSKSVTKLLQRNESLVWVKLDFDRWKEEVAILRPEDVLNEVVD